MELYKENGSNGTDKFTVLQIDWYRFLSSSIVDDLGNARSLLMWTALSDCVPVLTSIETQTAVLHCIPLDEYFIG